jgi:hypothetical protein
MVEIVSAGDRTELSEREKKAHTFFRESHKGIQFTCTISDLTGKPQVKISPESKQSPACARILSFATRPTSQRAKRNSQANVIRNSTILRGTCQILSELYLRGKSDEGNSRIRFVRKSNVCVRHQHSWCWEGGAYATWVSRSSTN